MGFLKDADGLSTVGAVFPIGGQDGRQSGDVAMTINAQVYDAVGSPMNMFKSGVSVHVNVEKEFSMVMLQFVKDGAPAALRVLGGLFSGRSPIGRSVDIAREMLTGQEEKGIISQDDILRHMSFMASYKGDMHRISCFADAPERLPVNRELSRALRHPKVLFGSEDMRKAIEELGAGLGKNPENKEKIMKYDFTPGVAARKATSSLIFGDTVRSFRDNVEVAVSWEGAGVASRDFFALRVLERLAGGSASLSSDGLGVGVESSLLSQHVLRRVMTCQRVSAQYWPLSQSGLFGVTANVHPDDMKLTMAGVKRAMEAVSKVSPKMLAATKEQAAFQYLKYMDDAVPVFREFGHQLLFLGEGKSTAGIVKALRSVTMDDIKRVHARILQTVPSVAVIGDVDPEEVAAFWKN